MMRPTRSDPAGRAYLDLQNTARREHRVTGELMTMYVVERWLARLARSPYADDFVLKGGMLLAGLGARRPTADADALVRNMAADEATVTARVVEIATTPFPEDGVEFDVSTVQVQQIRQESQYAGTRVRMWAGISTARIRLSLDINFGDPVTPDPQWIELPSVRSGTEPVRVLGYPIETVLAEKLSTAVTLGQTNTRVRDYADIYLLTGQHAIDGATMLSALQATSAFRGSTLLALSSIVGSIADERSAAYRAFRTRLGPDGDRLPDSFAAVVDAVVGFADPLIAATRSPGTWRPDSRTWLH
jgi:hypothetical protein